jgi:membrane protease YdiL (CAAX protease family)
VSTPPETALPEQPSYRQTDPAQTAEGPAAPDPPWGLLQALLTWIGSVFLLLLPQFFAIPYLVSHYRGVRPTAEVLLADKTFILIVVSGILPVHIITLVLAWAVVTRFGKVSAKKALGWSWPKGFGIWSSVGVALLLFVLAWLIALTLGNKETELERILQSSRAAALMIAFIATTTAPLVEETIYRGILYPALQRTIGPGFAVLVVALMFAGPHIPQYWPNAGAILSIALLSIVLTVVRARTGRLLPCFVIHLVFNGVQSLIIVSEPYLRAYIERARPQPNTVTLSYLLHFLR